MGDLQTLEALLAGDGQLATARSVRDHRSTLLHYSSANGVEPERQETPSNAPAVARMLLTHGADPDATSQIGDGGAMAGPSVTAVLGDR